MRTQAHSHHACSHTLTHTHTNPCTLMHFIHAQAYLNNTLTYIHTRPRIYPCKGSHSLTYSNALTHKTHTHIVFARHATSTIRKLSNAQAHTGTLTQPRAQWNLRRTVTRFWTHPPSRTQHTHAHLHIRPQMYTFAHTHMHLRALLHSPAHSCEYNEQKKKTASFSLFCCSHMCCRGVNRCQKDEAS